MRISKTLFAFMVLPLLLVGACSKSKDETPVAKVGDRTITLATYEKTYQAVDPKFLPENRDLDGRKEFLDTMINREVLAIKADELGYDKDPYVVQGMEAFKHKIDLSDKKLREAYKKYGTNLQIKQILVDTKEEADEVYRLLEEGNDFETVCKQYSKGPDAVEGGKVMSALYGTFEPQFTEVLFSDDTKVGDVTPPILSRYGYLIMKVVGSNQPKRKSFEQARSDLETIVRQQQQLRLMTEMSDAIREKYGFQWYEDNLRIVFDSLPPDRPLTNPPERSQEVYPLLDFDAMDLDKPLASYRDKSITVKDFSDLYDRASFFNRPRREFRYGGIKKFLLDIVMNELVAIEMEESNIENEPEEATMLQRKREQFMVDKQTEVGPEEMQEYYNDNLEQFRHPEQRRVAILLASDRDRAMEAYNKIMAGERFEKVSADYSVEELSRNERAGTQLVSKGQNPDFDDVAFALENVGDVSKPFQTSRGWMVVKLMERKPESVLPFDEAKEDIRRGLKSIKNEERLNALLDKWRGEVEIEVYDNNLMKANLDGAKKKALEFS
ncbi:MAG: peptidyl-prolyl cis-trans isomerase [bacterium]